MTAGAVLSGFASQLEMVERPMAKSIRVPSLQHMARNCRADPDLVARQLIQNVEHPPPFSCECLNVVARELVMLNTPIHQLQEYVRRAEPRL